MFEFLTRMYALGCVPSSWFFVTWSQICHLESMSTWIFLLLPPLAGKARGNPPL
jgi:hypothetical protein